MLAFDAQDNQKYVARGLKLVHNSRTLTAHLARSDGSIPCGRVFADHFRWGAATFMPLCTQCENFFDASDIK